MPSSFKPIIHWLINKFQKRQAWSMHLDNKINKSLLERKFNEKFTKELLDRRINLKNKEKS